MPRRRAASMRFVPASTSISLPSMVSFGIGPTRRGAGPLARAVLRRRPPFRRSSRAAARSSLPPPRTELRRQSRRSNRREARHQRRSSRKLVAMDFELTSEQQALRRRARDLADRAFAERAARWHASEEYPWENVKDLARVFQIGRAHV